MRFDIDAMWISATSSAIPRTRTSGGSDDQASTIRPNRPSSVCPGSTSTHRDLDGIDDVVERGPLGALARRGNGRHRVWVHERIGSVEGVERATRRSNASPCADPGPAHDARPIRCPSRRVRSKRSTVPADPSSATVCVKCPIEIRQIRGRHRRAGTASRAGSAGRRRSRRAACAATSSSRRGPCWRSPRAARRTTRHRSART